MAKLSNWGGVEGYELLEMKSVRRISEPREGWGCTGLRRGDVWTVEEA